MFPILVPLYLQCKGQLDISILLRSWLCILTASLISSYTQTRTEIPATSRKYISTQKTNALANDFAKAHSSTFHVRDQSFETVLNASIKLLQVDWIALISTPSDSVPL